MKYKYCKIHKECRIRHMRRLSFKRKDGTFINLNPDGNIWYITDKTGGPCLGNVKNKVCTIYGNGLGLDEKTKDKYYSVNKMVLKYGEALHIRQIRIQVTSTKQTHVGSRLIVRYAYINRDKFKYLLKRRKEVPFGANNTIRLILIKHSDCELKRY